MPEKTRYPDRDLSVADYITWLTFVIEWLGTQVGEPDYPEPLADALQPLLDALHVIYNDYITLKQLSGTRGKVYTSLSDDVLDQLRLLKDALPTIIDDPNVLAEFGLAEALPRDRDQIFHIAEVCVEHWGDVSGDAEFALMVGDFNTLVALFGDFVTARDNYYTTFNAAQQKQNEMLDARAACHEAERKVFTWYNARHRESEDEWWTGTWWGTTSGGAEEPTGPVHPAEVANLTVGLNPFNHNILNWLYGEAALFNVYRDVVHPGDTDPVRSAEPYVAGVATPTFTDTNHPVNGIYVYWVCAVKDGVEGEFAEPVSIEREGEEPIEPIPA